ncbi:MAG: aminotransferase class V-fold PLP-dependent enzyme [Ignavibacteriales bacterium]|nr:aminotransferase class V-fold PLP-dependent enzyme [Ignavibacteriales bacterium]
MLSPEKLSEARSLFPHTSKGKIYLNHAATTPLSTPVVDATIRYLEQRSVGTLENFTNDMKMITECREAIRKLINAESPDRVALVSNTSEALNIVSTGIPWKSGDRILLNSSEFPANVYPYLYLKNLGVEIDILEAPEGRIPMELMKRGITAKTRVVALSAVQFLSGYKADLVTIGDFCRKKNILFVVDGIQAIGAVRVDVQQMKIDALATGCQKWQLGQQGTGYLYITEELQRNIRQQHVGWLSAADPWDFHNFSQSLSSTARRYEPGTLNIPGWWGTQASLALLLEFGVEAIERHILSITRMLMDGLQRLDGLELMSPANDAERAGIVTVRPTGSLDAQAVFKEISDRNITTSVREGMLRFSPHFYNSPEDISLAVEVVRECLSEQLAR